MQVQLLRCDPASDVFAHAFDEVVVGLVSGLAELGLTTNVADRYEPDAGPAIVLAPHLHRREELLRLPSDVIMYNFEPMPGGRSRLMSADVRRLLARFVIWDYSASNLAVWRASGATRCFHVPLGYSAALARLYPTPPDPRYDVVFYGSLTQRRIGVLAEVSRRGFRVACLYGVYGDDRDRVIRSSRLVANIHADTPGILETPRLVPLWASGKPVAVEFNADTTDDLGMAPHATCAAYADLPNLIETLLTNPELRDAAADRSQAELARRWPQSRILAQALAGLGPAGGDPRRSSSVPALLGAAPGVSPSRPRHP